MESNQNPMVGGKKMNVEAYIKRYYKFLCNFYQILSDMAANTIQNQHVISP